MTDADADPNARSDADPDARADADTFGVAIQVTEDELRFVVHVPSDIDSGWTDPEAFQSLLERVVWDRLDRQSTLRAIAASAETGDSVVLGTVTLRPDGTVVSHSLESPSSSRAE